MAEAGSAVAAAAAPTVSNQRLRLSLLKSSSVKNVVIGKLNFG